MKQYFDWMLRFALLSLVFVESPASALEPMDLMRMAGTSPEHSLLDDHPFVGEMTRGMFRREQIAQLFQDRIYILATMEELLGNEILPDHPVFHRSQNYREELNLLVGKEGLFNPSTSALNYAASLRKKELSQISIHLWLFLTGETFGAQAVSKKIQQKFDYIGKELQNFQGFPLEEVRDAYKKWIAPILASSELSMEDGAQAIKEGFTFHLRIMQEARSAPVLDEHVLNLRSLL